MMKGRSGSGKSFVNLQLNVSSPNPNLYIDSNHKKHYPNSHLRVRKLVFTDLASFPDSGNHGFQRLLVRKIRKTRTL